MPEPRLELLALSFAAGRDGERARGEEQSDRGGARRTKRARRQPGAGVRPAPPRREGLGEETGQGEERQRGRRAPRHTAFDEALPTQSRVPAQLRDDGARLDGAEAVALEDAPVRRVREAPEPLGVGAAQHRPAAPVAERSALDRHLRPGLAPERDGHDARAERRQRGQADLLAPLRILAVGEKEQEPRARALGPERREGGPHALVEPRAALGDERLVERGKERAESLLVGRQRRQQDAAAGEGGERGAIAGAEPGEHLARQGPRALEAARRHVARAHALGDVEEEHDVDAARGHAQRPLAEAGSEERQRQRGEGGEEQRVGAAALDRERGRAEEPLRAQARERAAGEHRAERQRARRGELAREGGVGERDALHGILRAAPRPIRSSTRRRRPAPARKGSGRDSPVPRASASRSMRSCASISLYTAERSAEERAS